MASAYGILGAAGRADYVTTKTALIGLTRATAVETADFDITCNALCPGTVDTPAITGKIRRQAEADGQDYDAAVRDYLAQRQPGGRFIAADNVAALVVFLCGPAGRDISGATLPIDKGWVIT
jgi:3-hydroxybutyrate dehydrogenase